MTVEFGIARLTCDRCKHETLTSGQNQSDWGPDLSIPDGWASLRFERDCIRNTGELLRREVRVYIGPMEDGYLYEARVLCPSCVVEAKLTRGRHGVREAARIAVFIAKLKRRDALLGLVRLNA